MKCIKNEKGSVLVIVVVILVALLGFAALVTDIGMMIYHKSSLQNACDAAALAGAQELPDNAATAQTLAQEYAVDNGAQGGNVTIQFKEGNRKIQVQASETMAFTFARVLGINQGDLSVHATATVGPLSGLGSGLRPFGIEKDAFVLNQQVILKEGAPDGSSGNYGALRLDGGTGASHFEGMIVNGSGQYYEIGDTIPTETGTMVQKTIKGVQELIDNGIREIIVPIIDSLDISGTSDPVTIVGFAMFYIEDIQKEGGHTEITGRFIRTVAPGEVDQSVVDYGVSAVKLIE